MELRGELEEIFTEQECGGLECGTCGFALSAATLLDGKEKNGGLAAIGKLTSHRDSKQHKAAEDRRKKSTEPPAKVCRCVRIMAVCLYRACVYVWQDWPKPITDELID